MIPPLDRTSGRVGRAGRVGLIGNAALTSVSGRVGRAGRVGLIGNAALTSVIGAIGLVATIGMMVPATLGGVMMRFDDVMDQSNGGVVASESPMTVGVTHTQYSNDAYNDKASVQRADDILRSLTPIQNQHIMGFGADNPMPSPGVYDWRTLDARVNLIRRTGGQAVITLCCSPDWMKGGQAGKTDWSKIEVAPTSQHFDDFAALSAAVARRYPDVTHFQVWNELKGFWDAGRNRWNIEAYTVLYNKVYDALKAVNPNIQVGGPYVPMASWSTWQASGLHSELSGPWGVVDQRALDAVTYWLQHAKGADFLTVDGSNATKDRYLIASDITSNGKFVAITQWLRARTNLPIWWSELYPDINSRWEWAGSQRRAAVALDALVRLADAGASNVLLWQPQAASGLASVALWTDTRVSNGGQALPEVVMLDWLRRSLADNRHPEISWSGNIAMVGDGQTTLLVNTTSTPLWRMCGIFPVLVTGTAVVAGDCSLT